jgi:hypothetical protein
MDFSDKAHIFDEYNGTISRYMAQTLAYLIMNSHASLAHIRLCRYCKVVNSLAQQYWTF